MRLPSAVLVFLVLLASASFALTNVTTCMQINSSDTYVLQNDLFNGSVPANPNSVFSFVCMRISASNVTLDCNGFSITGNGSVDNGISANEEPTVLQNVTVKNCDVSGYHIGIYALSNLGSQFLNNTVHNNSFDGLFLTSVENTLASGNNAFGNNGEGIFLYGPDGGNMISGNTVCGNNGNGFRMTGFYSAATNSFANNIICNNTGDGMFADISSGILTVNSSGNHFYNNNHDVGMYDNVSLQMADDVFDNPAGSMANFTILSLSDAGTSGGYTINWSSAPSAPPAGLMPFGGRFLNISQATSGESIDSASWSWSDSEPVASLESLFQLWRFDGSGWVTLNTTPDTAANTLSLSGTVPGSVYSILLNATVCPAPITAPGAYALTGDTVGEPNDASEISSGAMACVKIGSADVVFDCGGFRIAGDGSAATSYGVALNSSASNVTLKNCPGISGFSTGVEAFNVNNTAIVNTTSAGNGEGFSLTSSGNNTFLLDLALNNSGTGFSVSTGDSSTISQSNSTGNGGSGFSVIAGNNLNMPIDVADGNNATGFSVIAGNSPNFAIDSSTNNNGFGFSVITGDNANFAIDTSTGNNGFGFSVISGNNPNFAINTALDNNGFGFSVITGDTPNFAINTATNNSGLGFSVITGNKPDFTLNGAANNSGSGFSIVSGANGTYNSNSALGNSGDGFAITSGDNTSYSSNNASGNTGDGFSLSPGASSSFVANYAQGNAGAGFILSGPLMNTFSGDFSGGNGGDGFTLSGGDQNALTGLTAAGNAVAGLSVSGSNNTIVTNAHLYGNAPDFIVDGVDGAGDVLNMTNATFDSPAGLFTNYTSLSVSDVVDSSYSISHSPQPAPLPGGEASFAGKFVNITNLTPSVSIDSLTFSWLDSEVTSGVVESSLRLFSYNGSWKQLSPLPNTGANTLTLANQTNFSVFGILQIPAASAGGGASGGGGATPALEISFDASTGTITITSGGSPVAGATVKADGTIIGTTDAGGQVTIPGCNETLAIDALKSGYTAASATVTLASCSAPPACTSDQNCSQTESCVAGSCVAVSCPGGTVVNHACAMPQNQTNQTCTAPSCCTDSSQCGDTQACVSASGAPATASSPGSCQQVTGQCGYAAGHVFVPYNYTCGTEPGCPSCPLGQSCVSHQCISNDITCPSTGIVGDNLTCRTTENGQACGAADNCTASVTLPDGRQLGANPDENGNVLLPLTLPGNYTITLLKNGQVVKVLRVSALPKSVPSEQNPPTAAGPDLGSILWLLLLLLVVVGAVIYWRSRGKK